ALPIPAHHWRSERNRQNQPYVLHRYAHSGHFLHGNGHEESERQNAFWPPTRPPCGAGTKPDTRKDERSTHEADLEQQKQDQILRGASGQPNRPPKSVEHPHRPPPENGALLEHRDPRRPDDVPSRDAPRLQRLSPANNRNGVSCDHGRETNERDG